MPSWHPCLLNNKKVNSGSVDNLIGWALDGDGATGARGLSTPAPWRMTVLGHPKRSKP